MSNATLYIQNTEVPLLNDVSIPIVYSIEDIISPDKTSTNFALTIELPGTKELDLIFESIFDPAADLQYFNPNLKTDVQLNVANVDVFVGSIKLVKAVNNLETGSTKYICDFIGSKADLFHEIGEKYLTGNTDPLDDLDFSEYDHDLTVTNVTNSWATSNVVSGTPTALVAGAGYRYGLIDYGMDGSGVNATAAGYDFNIKHLRPLLAVREYLEKIFEAAGKTWTSSFLDGIFFKKLFIPPSEPLTKPQTTIDDGSCYVGTTGVNYGEALTYSGAGGIWNGSSGDINVLELDDDTTGDLDDPNGIWDTTLFQFTAPQDGIYHFTLNMTVGIGISRLGGTGLFQWCSYDYSIAIQIQKFISGVWSTVAATPFNAGSQPLNTPPNSYNTSMPLNADVICSTGDLVRCIVDTRVTNALLQDVAFNPIVDGTVSYGPGISATSSNVNTLGITIDSELIEGEEVEVNRTLPLKIKQKDFVKSIFQMFNLYVYEDKNTPNNYLIEPRDSFFSTTKVDWTDKLSISTPVENLIMGELDAKRYIRRFSEDGDYFNKLYQDSWGEVYGTKEDTVENQFLTGENVIECIFSPTPMVGQYNSVNEYMIIPHIYSFENSVAEPMVSNIRILLYNGLLNGLYTQGTSPCWNLVSTAGDNLQTQIPYTGTLDTFDSPTFDLNFGVPEEIFIETSPPYVWASTNLSTDYWNNFIELISNKNSRVVRMGMILDEADIKTFDFRKPVIVRGVTYLVNKIDGYDPTDRRITMIEFLKLQS